MSLAKKMFNDLDYDYNFQDNIITYKYIKDMSDVKYHTITFDLTNNIIYTNICQNRYYNTQDNNIARRFEIELNTSTIKLVESIIQQIKEIGEI